MKILVIGGSGLIGPCLVDELDEAGHEAVCLNRRGLHPRGGRAISGDREKSDDLLHAIDRVKPSVIVDMIPFTEDQARTLAAILRATRIPLIACSSIDVYRAFNVLHRDDGGFPQTVPLRETDAMRKTTSFQGPGYDKLGVETQYLSLPGDVSIFRLPAVYGVPDTSRVKPYVEKILQDRPVVLHPQEASWRFSRSLNTNCAFAISLAVGLHGNHVFNVAEPSDYTEREWFDRIALLMNRDVTIEEDVSAPTDYNFTQPLTASSDLIRDRLKFREKHDPASGLGKAIDRLLLGR